MAEELKQAEEKLYLKGYYICNQFLGFGSVGDPEQYELIDRDGNTAIDHLSKSQVVALAEML